MYNKILMISWSDIQDKQKAFMNNQNKVVIYVGVFGLWAVMFS